MFGIYVGELNVNKQQDLNGADMYKAEKMLYNLILQLSLLEIISFTQ